MRREEVQGLKKKDRRKKRRKKISLILLSKNREETSGSKTKKGKRTKDVFEFDTKREGALIGKLNL
jgi:hypothetical protein